MKKNYLMYLTLIMLLSLALYSCAPVSAPTIPQENGENEDGATDESGEDLPPENDGEFPGSDEGEEIPEELTLEETIQLYSFLSSPIAGARVSSVDGQLPNAPRRYRNGVHEGLDYFEVERGEPVLAAADGVVIRSDYDYVEMTLEEYEEVIRISMEEEITPEEMLDKLRGRQVWIAHQHDIITRYAHLESIPEDVRVGDVVEKGQVIGTVGDSGSKSGVVGYTVSGNSAPHLHFEIWRGDRFLGQGLPPDEVRHIYTEILKD